ncbi:hypothetical protein [Streptomyces sp. NPDC127114]|uniref:hypothetical protein n=1 Tax=Streptomyces sp. NPDC127114 TaxID=3345366 RepID=UPI0036277FBC
MIGTVIAILGLFVSVATAVVGYRHGQRAERAQQRRDEREAADRRRLQEEADRTERIRQASWISTLIEADGLHVEVYNGSSQPVSNVHVLAGDTPLQPHVDRRQDLVLGVTPTSRRLLTPGRSLFFVRDPQDSTSELDLARVTVEFRDVAGRVWQRTAAGALRERISPDDAPPEWSTTMAPLVEPYREPSPEGGRYFDGPPSGPLGGASQPPLPPPPYGSGVSRAASLRSRRAFSCLFVLGCLGAAAALAYLISQLA